MPNEKAPSSLERSGEASIDRLKKISPQELIPPELFAYPGVDIPRAEIRLETNGIKYIITDNHTMSDLKINETFGLFDTRDVAAYPDTTLSKRDNIYRRPLIIGEMREIAPFHLFGGVIEIHPSLRGGKVSKMFLENLFSLARKCHYRFASGYHNDTKIAAAFLKCGMFLLEEIKEEHRGEFQVTLEQAEERRDEVFFTVKFLKDEDVDTYVDKSLAERSIEERLDARTRYTEISSILRYIKDMNEDNGVSLKRDLLVTMVEVLESFNEKLSPETRLNQPPISEDDPNVSQKIGQLTLHLEKHLSELASTLSVNQIQEEYYNVLHNFRP